MMNNNDILIDIEAGEAVGNIYKITYGYEQSGVVPEIKPPDRPKGEYSGRAWDWYVEGFSTLFGEGVAPRHNILWQWRES